MFFITFISRMIKCKHTVWSIISNIMSSKRPLDVTKQSFLINADQLGLNYKDTLFVEWSLQSVPIKDNVKRFVTYVALKVISMTQYDVYFFIKPTSTVEGCFLYDSQLFVSCIRYFLASREDVQITLSVSFMLLFIWCNNMGDHFNGLLINTLLVYCLI
jgi:hypothetical protein